MPNTTFDRTAYPRFPRVLIDRDLEEKRVKYNDLVANALMVQNVVDMTRLPRQLGGQGYTLNPEILGMFSPYLTRHIKRFGEYVVRLDQEPEALNGDTWILPP